MTPNQILWKALNEALVPVAERAILDMSSAQKEVATERPRTTSLETGRLDHPDEKSAGPVSRGVSPDFLRTVREAVNVARAGKVAAPAVAVALSSEQDQVFQTARRRTAWYFALNLLVAIATSLLFLGGAAGAIVTAVSSGANIWTAVFGGTSVAGAFWLFIGRPIQMTYAALLATTRLDWLQLMSHQRMQDCGSLPTLTEQIKCRSNVWDQIRDELASLEQRNGKTDSTVANGEHLPAQST